MLTPLPPVQYVPPPLTTCATGRALTITVALPFMLFTQPVMVLVARTVYVAAVVSKPNDSSPPVPVTLDNNDVPLYSP